MIFALLSALLPVAPQTTEFDHVVPFPLASEAGARDSGLRANPAALERMTGLESVRLTGFPINEAQSADLELRRLSYEALTAGFLLDGAPAPELAAVSELSIWTGHVVGEPDSDVFLSFSLAGSRGWVRHADGLAHLLAQPDADGSWYSARMSVRDQRDLPSEDSGLANFCMVGADGGDEFEAHASAPAPLSAPVLPGSNSPSFGASMGGGVGSRYGADLLIETDYQLSQVFGGDASAEAAYVTSLLAAAADRWSGQLGVELSFPYVQFYTTPNDPWNAPDSGGSVVSQFIELIVTVSGNFPAAGDLLHFLSGSLGGGVASAGMLCDEANEMGFGVTGLNGSTQFPVAQGPFSQDFIIFAHELGHSFGTHHTHDYEPTIDNCAFGGCISNGTLMSACNACGGYSNITTFFHPDVVDNLRADIAACLPLVLGIEAPFVEVLAPQVALPLEVSVVGTPLAGVELCYLINGSGSSNVIPMTDAGNGAWTADLPAFACGDEVEFFFQMDTASFGIVESERRFTRVGCEEVLFADNFQTNQGWTVGAAGDNASSGVWARVDPNPTYGQPDTGVNVDSGPFCFVTGQGSPGGFSGQNEVEGGKTTLTSPAIDLTDGDAEIGYWRWYYNADISGNDVLAVEISNNGSTWFTVEEVGTPDPAALGGWVRRRFLVSDYVAPSAQVRVRFVAEDFGQSWVTEAAIDDFLVQRISCDPGCGESGPEFYCTAKASSIGCIATLSTSSVAQPVSGSSDYQVFASDVHSFRTGLLFAGISGAAALPFSGGTLCMNPPLKRGPLINSGGFAFNDCTGGYGQLVNDGAIVPLGLDAGSGNSAWYQYWHRDPPNGSGTLGTALSNAVRLDFQ